MMKRSREVNRSLFTNMPPPHPHHESLREREKLNSPNLGGDSKGRVDLSLDRGPLMVSSHKGKEVRERIIQL